MKKQAFVFLASLLLSPLVFAEYLKTKKMDVLAICAETSTSTPLFEILGDLQLFSGPRFTVQYGNVLLKNVHSRLVFDGIVTLTKSAPYQYILNAVSTPSIAGALSHAEEVSSIYGISMGNQMNVVKNQDGVKISSYTCVLNTILLLNP